VLTARQGASELPPPFPQAWKQIEDRREGVFPALAPPTAAAAPPISTTRLGETAASAKMSPKDCTAFRPKDEPVGKLR
jgi:hypothetical protein